MGARWLISHRGELLVWSLGLLPTLGWLHWCGVEAWQEWGAGTGGWLPWTLSQAELQLNPQLLKWMLVPQALK